MIHDTEISVRKTTVKEKDIIGKINFSSSFVFNTIITQVKGKYWNFFINSIKFSYEY